MKDISMKLERILQDIAPVELANNEHSPHLQFFTISASTRTEVAFTGRDFLEDIVVQIDCYADTTKKCVDMATKANDRLQKYGFTRTEGRLMNPQRYLLRFSAKMDEKFNVFKEA